MEEKHLPSAEAIYSKINASGGYPSGESQEYSMGSLGHFIPVKHEAFNRETFSL